MWFVRLESPLARALVLGAVWVTAGATAWSILKPGVADWMGRGALGAAAIERVAAWDPRNPRARTAAGRVLAESASVGDLARARRHLEAALRGWPSHGFAWLRLAEIADRQGDRARARRAIDLALGRDPHNTALRWDAAALLLQWGETAAAMEHLRYVLAADPGQRHMAFQLLRQLGGPGEAVERLLPARADALGHILEAGLREGDLALARAAWERRVRLDPPLPESLHRRYLDLLVRQGAGEAARRAWAAVGPRGGPSGPYSEIWDGGFEGDPLVGWGLGWRAARVWGVQVQIDRGVAARGAQSLRLSFSGFPNLEFRGVSQTVPVRPGQPYALEALVRASDFTTHSGLRLRVVVPRGQTVLAETDAVSGTTPGWKRVTARVDVPSDVSLVEVVLCRDRASEPEGNLGGKVWVDEVTLVPLRGAA